MFSLYAKWTMSYVYGFQRNFLTRCFDLQQVRLIGPNFTAFFEGLPSRYSARPAARVMVATRTSSRKFDASSGDLGLQDGRRRLVEVVGWLRWKLAHPLTIGPGKAEQTKRRGPRSFVQWGVPPWPAALRPLPRFSISTALDREGSDDLPLRSAVQQLSTATLVHTGGRGRTYRDE